jgi:hypothetical protein
MANLYPNGIGASGGSRYAKAKNLTLASGASPYRGNIYYVHHTGSDSNSGLEINKPFATIGKAFGTGSNSVITGTNLVPGAVAIGDVIAVLPGHRETIRYGNNTLVIAGSITSVKIIGMGDGEEMPYIDCEDDVTLANLRGCTLVTGIRFGQSLSRSNAVNAHATRIIVNINATVFEDCIFETGDNDGDPTEESGSNLFDYLYSTVLIDASTTEFYRCLFKNTATLYPQRVQAVRIYTQRAGIKFYDCMFDGGETGWGPPAFSYGRPWASSYYAISGFMAVDLVLINGADFSIETNGIQIAFVTVKSSNGSSQVIS